MKTLIFITTFLLLFVFQIKGQTSARVEAIQLVQKADKFMRFGNWEEAEILYTNAIEFDLGYAEAYMKRARLYKNLGRYNESMNDYNKAISINPYSEYAYDQRAAVKMLNNNYNGAIKDLQKAIELNPENTEYKVKLIDDYILSGQHSKAFSDLDSLKRSGYESLEIKFKEIKLKIKSRKFTEAENDLLVMLDTSSINKFLILDLLGLIYLKQGFYNKSIDFFNQSIELNNKCELTYHNRSIAHRLSGNLDLSQRDLDTAIMLNTSNENIYFSRAIVRKEAGDLKGAIDDYDRAIGIDSTYKDAIYNKLYTKKLLGDYSSALLGIQKIVEENPDSPENWNLLGSVQVIYTDYFEAVESFSQAIQLNQSYAEAYHNRGVALIMSYRPIQGCEDLSHSLFNLNFEESENVFRAFCGF